MQKGDNESIISEKVLKNSLRQAHAGVENTNIERGGTFEKFSHADRLEMKGNENSTSPRR